MSLSAATQSRPFSNGTEGDAWTSKWCDYCVHDHAMHGPNGPGPGCQILGDAMLGGGEWSWREAWLPEPDDGRFFLPSRLICGMFKPCNEGDCAGDPGAVERAERVAEVTLYWSERR